MDIAQYIVKFLIKNKYCNLLGLGEFQLVKTAPAVKKESGEITPAKFDIRFTTSGSIDDAFAAYIAGFENVSISKTSNNIKTFCREAKEELQKSGKFTIEHLGYLNHSNNQIVFVQTDELDMGSAALPLPEIDNKAKNSTDKKLDFSYPAAKSDSKNRKKIALSKFLLPLILVLFLITVVFFAYRYIASSQELQHETQTMNNTSEVLTPPTPQDSQNNNITTTSDSVSNTPISPNSDGLYKIALFQFNNQAQADAKSKKLNSFGNKTEVIDNNGNFIVAILASNPQNDTTKLVDSLRKFFNPRGNVYLIK